MTLHFSCQAFHPCEYLPGILCILSGFLCISGRFCCLTGNGIHHQLKTTQCLRTGIILRHGTEKIIQCTRSGIFIHGDGPGMRRLKTFNPQDDAVLTILNIHAVTPGFIRVF